jgi:hypothetical protein
MRNRKIPLSEMVDVNGVPLTELLGITVRYLQALRSQGRLLRRIREAGKIEISPELAAKLDDKPASASDGAPIADAAPAAASTAPVSDGHVPAAPAPVADDPAPTATQAQPSGRQPPPPREHLVSFTVRLPLPLHDWLLRHAFEFKTTNQAVAREAFEDFRRKVESGG